MARRRHPHRRDLVVLRGGRGAGPRTGYVPQLGFDTYVQDLCQSAATWQSDASGQFTELKSLGANAVALAFPIYMTGTNSDTVYTKRTCSTTFQTPSTARLAVAIKEAHTLHLTVLLRPMVQQTVLTDGRGDDPPQARRRVVRQLPQGPDALPEARPARKVELLRHLDGARQPGEKSNWTSLIANAKRDYKGQLIFTDVWRPVR